MKMQTLRTYINEKLILSKTKYKHPVEQYFYHEALEDGYRTKIVDTENIFQYSIDNCQTWHDLKIYTETPEINKGEHIYFKGENTEATDYGIGEFRSNKKFNAGGNIMSLIYGDDFEDKTKLLQSYQFRSLFYNNTTLISAKDLVLPATKLTGQCYANMFDNAYNLIDTPELPASELTDECYKYMFRSCSSLTKTPELHATKLATECYHCMFYKCTSLKEITMLATDIYGDDCLCCWVVGTSDSGTFIKSKGTDIPEGIHGIPKGWMVKEI